MRNEGVGIMLDERASAAWREAGEAWEAISSRVVTARLKAMGRGQRRPGGARTTRNSFISVISAYALGLLYFMAFFLVGSVSSKSTIDIPEETGNYVVNVVLKQLNESGLETDETTLVFLRRLAWVESRFGSGPYTFRLGFHGGIWQIGLRAFRDTQNANKHPILLEKHQRISDIFKIVCLRE